MDGGEAANLLQEKEIGKRERQSTFLSQGILQKATKYSALWALSGLHYMNNQAFVSQWACFVHHSKCNARKSTDDWFSCERRSSYYMKIAVSPHSRLCRPQYLS